LNAQEVQKMRYNSSNIYNASLSSAAIKKQLRLSPDARKVLLKASEKLGLTARSYFKIIKLAQTIADLDFETQDKVIQTAHIAEALQYRTSSAGGR